MARWDGSKWSPLGSGATDFVAAITVLGREVYVGGNFDSIDDLLVGGGFARLGDTRAAGFCIWHIPQQLEIVSRGSTVTLFWPTQAVDFVAQSAPTLLNPQWTDISTTPEIVDRRYSITRETLRPNEIFRLQRPY